jgi:hypothetical protein
MNRRMTTAAGALLFATAVFGQHAKTDYDRPQTSPSTRRIRGRRSNARSSVGRENQSAVNKSSPQGFAGRIWRRRARRRGRE